MIPARLRVTTRIVAGAGTGKTELIVSRFLELVTAGVEPPSILALTFSERAAAELRLRIENRLGNWAGELWVGTFHSVAQRLLREDGWRVGVPAAFRVLAGAERWIVLRELLWELGDEALIGVERPDDMVAPLLRLLERMKQELVEVSALAGWARRTPDRELGDVLVAACRLFDAYDRHCRRARRLDFDDLILRLVRLLESNSQVREAYVKRFTSVLVDEYQDSNLAQERMVELLAGKGNAFVVGDDDQAIYRFRGASLASLERFVRIFPGARTRSLGRNRRSSANVVAVSAAVAAANSDRLPKRLSSARAAGPKVEVWHAADGFSEAHAVVEEIRRLAEGGTPLSAMALLLRTNALARPFTLALRSAGLPFQLWGARGFYRRPEVLDVIAWLRLLDDSADEVALARVVTAPGAELPVDEALERMRLGRAAGEAPLAALAEWPAAADWLATTRALLALVPRLGVDELFFELMARTRYLDLVRLETESERRQVAANLGKFAELLDAFCEARPDHSLRAFLAHLELVLLSEVDEEVAQPDEIVPALQVMTIHQAKGLEFDAVFVPALVEGRLPQPRRQDRFRLPADLVPDAAGREDQVAEERRLCYVAMTRARDRLYLSWADRYEGARGWRRSRFLEEALRAGGKHFRQRELEPLPSAAGERPRLEPPRPNGRVMLSFTSIAAYRECPRQYRFRYVYRLPARQTAEAVYGVVVHRALLEAGRHRAAGETVDARLMEGLLDQAWAEARFPDPRRQPALRRLSSRQLRRYVEAGGFAAAPHLLEEGFELTLDGFRLRGVIDRLDAPGTSGAWRLVDYKTGSPQPASRLRRDLQLALYALAAREALDIDAVELEIVHLKDASQVVLPATDELLSQAREVAREVAAGVGAAWFESRPERRRCSLCPYRLACTDAM